MFFCNVLLKGKIVGFGILLQGTLCFSGGKLIHCLVLESQHFQGEWDAEGGIIFVCNILPEFTNKCRLVDFPGFVPLSQELWVGPNSQCLLSSPGPFCTSPLQAYNGIQ